MLQTERRSGVGDDLPYSSLQFFPRAQSAAQRATAAEAESRPRQQRMHRPAALPPQRRVNGIPPCGGHMPALTPRGGAGGGLSTRACQRPKQSRPLSLRHRQRLNSSLPTTLELSPSRHDRGTGGRGSPRHPAGLRALSVPRSTPAPLAPLSYEETSPGRPRNPRGAYARAAGRSATLGAHARYRPGRVPPHPLCLAPPGLHRDASPPRRRCHTGPSALPPAVTAARRLPRHSPPSRAEIGPGVPRGRGRPENGNRHRASPPPNCRRRRRAHREQLTAAPPPPRAPRPHPAANGRRGCRAATAAAREGAARERLRRGAREPGRWRASLRGRGR